MSTSSFIYYFKDFIYLFLERGERREKERERNINAWLPWLCPLLGTWPTTQACALTGNRTSDPLPHSLALNPLSHTSQGCFYFLSEIKILGYQLLVKMEERKTWCGIWREWRSSHLREESKLTRLGKYRRNTRNYCFQDILKASWGLVLKFKVRSGSMVLWFS